MLVIRLVHLKDMPSYEHLLDSAQVESKERDAIVYNNTVPANSFSMSKKNLKTTGQLVRADTAQYGNSFPAGAF